MLGLPPVLDELRHVPPLPSVGGRADRLLRCRPAASPPPRRRGPPVLGGRGDPGRLLSADSGAARSAHGAGARPGRDVGRAIGAGQWRPTWPSGAGHAARSAPSAPRLGRSRSLRTELPATPVGVQAPIRATAFVAAGRRLARRPGGPERAGSNARERGPQRPTQSSVVPPRQPYAGGQVASEAGSATVRSIGVPGARFWPGEGDCAITVESSAAV